MSIDSFGAIVSDNDGSAFITKAEFDSKVNEFNTEINRYETSIDAKLQGAISSYVEGIRIQDRPTILYDKLRNVIGNKNPYFLNSATTGSSSLSSNVVINKNKNYSTAYKVEDVKVPRLLNTTIKIKVYNSAALNNSWKLRPVCQLTSGTRTAPTNPNSEIIYPPSFLYAKETKTCLFEIPALEDTKINFAVR